MKLGIDFGTTRTIVAQVDRGNYPVVSFLDADGDPAEHFPSVVALDGSRLVYGFEALAAQAKGAPLVRSFKRLLADPDVSLDTTMTIGKVTLPLVDVLTGFLTALRHALLTRSNMVGQLPQNEPIDAAVAVPAHAHSAQRFLTLEAFRRAGFEVRTMLNEPSAAGFEYTHRQGRTLNSKRTRVIVYDLGGGTWDASLVRVDDRDHEVLDSLGINRLGGDDFDELLAWCAITEAGTTRTDLGDAGWELLLDDARSAKENLSPQTKRVALDVADRQVVVGVDAFYRAAAPLVERTLEAMEPLVGGLDSDKMADVAGIYLVGGGSGLPLVARVLRERFGRRVHRSPYPAASTAIGLAISLDAEAGYSLRDRLSRGFGVFREAKEGAELAFDPIFDRSQAVTDDSEVIVTRRYRPVHNVGWFRFVEYTRMDADGHPRGDIAPMGQVIFPFDPDLQGRKGLRGVPVTHRDGNNEIEERYVIDRHGIVSVHITDLGTGFTVSRQLAN